MYLPYLDVPSTVNFISIVNALKISHWIAFYSKDPELYVVRFDLFEDRVWAKYNSNVMPTASTDLWSSIIDFEWSLDFGNRKLASFRENVTVIVETKEWASMITFTFTIAT